MVGGAFRIGVLAWGAGFSPREALASLSRSGAEAPRGLNSALRTRAAATGLLLSLCAAGQTPARITGPIDESVRVTLAGSIHPLARPELAGRRVAPDLALDRMILLLDAGDEADSDLRAFIDRLSESPLRRCARERP